VTDVEITAEPGVPQIIITREFAASPAVLLRAYTEPDLLARWIGPRAYRTTVDILEPRDGGRWRYTHTVPDGDRYSFFGLFHGDPTVRQIVQTYEFDRQPGRIFLNTITFHAQGSRTRLRQNTVFPSVEDRDVYLLGGMEKGIHASMAQLDELVTGLPR
jgi:uncharacterized protein YndB with AHSA1/START domain